MNFVIICIIFLIERTFACPKKIELRYSRDCPYCPECRDINSKYYNENWCIEPLCTKMKIDPTFCKPEGIDTIAYVGECGATKCNNLQVNY